MEMIGKILSYALWIILGLLLLLIIGISLYYVYKWLLSKTESRTEKQSARDLFLLLLERFRSLLRAAGNRLSRILKGYKNAVQLYAALLRWGRHSSLARSVSETPHEYGSRLKHRFPVLGTEIESIVQAFNEEVYGEITLSESQLTIAQSAWRKLRSPFLWPTRVRAWFRRPLDPQT
jgi:hypothetical protein